MLYRKSYETIEKWVDDGKKALLIDGARQVGKTTIIRECLQNKKVNFIELNQL